MKFFKQKVHFVSIAFMSKKTQGCVKNKEFILYENSLLKLMRFK